MKHIKGKMVRVCQVTSYLRASEIVEFLENEKDLGVLRVKVKAVQYGKRSSELYAAFLVLKEDDVVLGRVEELVPITDLIKPTLYIADKGVRKTLHLAESAKKCA